MSVPSLRSTVGMLLDSSANDLPQSLMLRASAIVMDTVSVAWTAPDDLHFGALQLQGDEQGASSTVFGKNANAATETAAFCNATAAVWNELDEGFRGAGHPAAHVVPAGVALAESLGLTGQQLLIAVVRGYELQAQLGKATTLRPEVHAHGALGAPAAALTVASLLGLSVDQSTHAVNIAANLAPAGLWESCLRGQTVRNTFAGTGAQIGIRAAQLAQRGMTAPSDSCDLAYGVIRGTKFAHWEDFTGSWSIGKGYLKQWAACAYSHTVLDVLDDICQAGEVRPDDVVKVTVHVPEVGGLLSDVATGSLLAIRFSIPTLVALMVNGVDLKQPLAPAHLDDRIVQFSSRVGVVVDTEMSNSWPLQSRARVEVELRNQRVLTQESDNPHTPKSNEEFVREVEIKGNRLHPLLRPEYFRLRIENLLTTPRVAQIFSRPDPLEPPKAMTTQDFYNRQRESNH